SAAFSGDSKIMALASGNEIYLCDMRARREMQRIKHGSGVQRLSVSADGTVLATLGFKTQAGPMMQGLGTLSIVPERAIRIWDIRSAKELRQIVLPSKKPGAFEEVLFLPDGKKLVTSDSEAVLQIWDAS